MRDRNLLDGVDPSLGIYHRGKRMFVDALKAAVMTECPYSLLAEILFCFNDDAVKFLHIFAGRTIVVPSVLPSLAKSYGVPGSNGPSSPTVATCIGALSWASWT